MDLFKNAFPISIFIKYLKYNYCNLDCKIYITI